MFNSRQGKAWASLLMMLRMIAFLHAATPATEMSSASMTDRLSQVREITLDGSWEIGIDRRYERTIQVPGLVSDPTKITPGTLWYRRMVDLPAGSWTAATLTLKGARFAPEVYLDGKKVSAANGGMAATTHDFSIPAGVATRTVTLEIALKSLKDLDPHDASAVPGADRWRTNVSSYLWDSVILRLHGAAAIEHVVPWVEVEKDSANIHWTLKGDRRAVDSIRFRVLDDHSAVLVSSDTALPAGSEGEVAMDFRRRLHWWSPDRPSVYRLRAELLRSGVIVDAIEQTFGVRDFRIRGLGFELNGKPFNLRMGTVVWHRWSCDPEAKQIAFDSTWFKRNIVDRLKALGANGMRFHLGLPPETFLDLCDRFGLAVQLEWPFFHGVSASRESMSEQWRVWLDTAVRHPSVVLIHPWNETGGEQLKLARSALDPLLESYPPMVVCHRDVAPIHKYWWSLFENLGLYYDSADQFEMPVVADEFGGNYLDGDANPGLYPETKGAFLRFLGRGNTGQERLNLQSDANARVAEYWRRLGIAGFSPFCILGSTHDGNHWFLGKTDVAYAELKPVWAALAAAFAPRSISLELWNRNFLPGETISAPLWFFNDTDDDATLTASVTINAEPGSHRGEPIMFASKVKAHARVSQIIAIPLPATAGEWRVSATLIGADAGQTSPIVSSWHIRTLVPNLPPELKGVAVGVDATEVELRQALTRAGVDVANWNDPAVRVIVGSNATWRKCRDNADARGRIEAALRAGVSVVLLDAGPQPLGAGYVDGKHLGGSLEAAPSVHTPSVLETVPLNGVSISFVETAEPESTLQQPESNKSLWNGLPKEATWLWNGLRGGLIVPAADMQISGIGGDAILAIWKERGVDTSAIQQNRCFAYELAGYYEYASKADSKSVSDRLRARVKFLVEDAPALQNVVNPDAPITIVNLGAIYREQAEAARGRFFIALACAGKNLNRTPAVKIQFSSGMGSLVLSQLLTRGRLTPGLHEAGPGVYGLRYDPVAEQVVLNLVAAGVQ